MKKFLMTLAATTMAVSPVLTASAQAAPHRQQVVHTTVKHDNRGHRVVKQTRVVKKNDYRHWAKGQRFDRRYASNYRVINNPRSHRLYNAPRGYYWARSGNDAVLIALTGGIIGAVITGAFR